MKYKVNDKGIFYPACKMQQNRQENKVCRYLQVYDFFYSGEINIVTVIAVLEIGQQHKNTEVVQKKHCAHNINGFLLQGDIKEFTRKNSSYNYSGYSYPSKPDKPVSPLYQPDILRYWFHAGTLF
jgi:hypothetical protein